MKQFNLNFNKKNNKVTTENYYINSISFRLPRCSTINEFEQLIYSNNIESQYKLTNIDMFDYTKAQFTKKEANNLDPHYRLMYETIYESLNEYNVVGKSKLIIGCPQVTEYITKTNEKLILNLPNIFCRNIASKFNIDDYEYINTECSTFLYIVNKATNYLNNGYDNIIISVASLNINNNYKDLFDLINVYSKSNKMCPFDENADGFIITDCVGCIILSKNPNNSYGEIVASNHNYSKITYPLTAPHGDSIKENIQQTVLNSKLNIKDIGYVEAHGTSTMLGDQIEFKAINGVFGNNNITIGCNKSIFGHSGISSGFTELLYSFVILKNQIVPSNINFNKLNKMINMPTYYIFTNKQVRINTEYALINSYGLSGINACLIIKKSNNILPVKQIVEWNRVRCWYDESNEDIQIVESLNEYIDENSLSSDQKLIYEILKKTLKCDKMKLTDDFFGLGGNSVKAMELVNYIIDNTNIEIDIEYLMKYKKISYILNIYK